ncbi:hypothetical protein BOTBODRAFT_154187 [Botryobasidium botryosum FD-172 SS1]|uniref:Heterokaryon incompatibility domain-containing protein n=1 Tax=Botryobasidium botryosum (strain FD-172 SS1) TaxID=930990 RepID=A0A067MRT8_BOTB1|nr:hypothetical protein BOTBODRAFT_154187 [Botryobasidium botryosum FD-172 SS1]
MSCATSILSGFYRRVSTVFQQCGTSRPPLSPSGGSPHSIIQTVVSSNINAVHGNTSNLVHAHDPERQLRSLVCQACWVGLFASDSFQEAWSSVGLNSGFSYTTTWSHVQISADQDCNWCKLLLSIRGETMQQNSLRVTVGFRHTSNRDTSTPTGVQTLKISINNMPKSNYFVYATSDNLSATYIVARSPVLQVASPLAFGLASDCIADCIRHHERCHRPHDTTLPTRVVDCSDPEKPRLLVTNGDRDSYVALSYVWGEAQPHSTRTHNLSSYLAGIDTDLLPQTIKDAIACTHQYGLRYLWVDALCILQDSREDKNREIAHMRTIFRDAYITIIAAAAHKVSDGFLQDRPATSIASDICLPFPCPGVPGHVGTMSLSPTWLQYDGSSEPVNQRAWCLEERLLSRRALVYASHTLQYHCQTAVVNVGKSVCGRMIGQRLPDLMFLPDAEVPATLPKSELKKLRWAWQDVLADYTQRAVTKPADKLLALSGVTEQFHRVWRCRYLAGLWQDTLLEDLLWYKDFEIRLPRPGGYRAPSWSWASVDGRILAFTLDGRLDADSGEVETCDVVECEVALAYESLPFGKVTAGTLKLHATMKKALWNPDVPMPELFIQRCALDVNDKLCVGCAYPDSSENIGEVWAVPVRWNRQSQYAAGLIVTPADEGCYRRVGYFHSPQDSPSGLEWFEGCPKQNIVIF